MNAILTGLLGPMLAKMAVVALLLTGTYMAVTHAPKAWAAWQDIRDDAAGDLMHGEPTDHRGPKWGEPGSRERHAGFSSTDGEIYIWVAKNYILIGSEDDVMYRNPADVLGWGLDRTKHLVDIVTLEKMFDGKVFASRAAAQGFLNSAITRHGRIPLVSANRKGMIGGHWYNTTNALSN